MKITSLLFIAFLINANATFSQPPLFSYNKFISNADTLNYRFLSPDYNTLRKYPLIIFLHGSGERGNDNEAQLKWGVMNFATPQAMSMHPSFIIAPQCPEGVRWSNYISDEEIHLSSTPTKPMKLLMDLIQDVIKKFAIDTNRIYITGMSMGGYGTYDIIERNPSLFAAAVPVCGGGDTTKASTIAHIPIWIFHGAEDPAVKTTCSINMLLALVKAGAHPGCTIYPEVGHFSWLQAYSDPLMIEWLFRQHK